MFKIPGPIKRHFETRWPVLVRITKRIKPVGWVVAVLGVALGALGYYRDEFPNQRQPVYLGDVLGWLPWYVWVLAALLTILVVGFEAAYREITQLTNDTDTDESIRLTRPLRLRAWELEGRTFDTAELFLRSGENLALGVKVHDFAVVLERNCKLNNTPTLDEVQPILAEMRIANVIYSEHRQASEPSKGGIYPSMSSLPHDVYFISEQGTKVLRILRDWHMEELLATRKPQASATSSA
jgi:hypothetical protein